MIAFLIWHNKFGDEGEQNNGSAIGIHGVALLQIYYRDKMIRLEAVSYGLNQILSVLGAMTADGVLIESAANAIRLYAKEDPWLRQFAADAGCIYLLDYFYSYYSNDDPVRRALKLALAELEGGYPPLTLPGTRV